MKGLTIVLIVLVFCIGDTHGRNVLMIVNRLPKNGTLRVHCYSKDDDLSVIYLHRNDPPLSWRFNDAYFRETKFTCDLRQGNHWAHHRTFVSYKSSMNPSQKNNANATWYAGAKGLYLSFNYRTPELMYIWM
ncbi:unnamed protein product [Arabidopsis lyrata]|uniref:S-protein homolog n=1 Tax=Arabidopsis lyrata subsp. lyrata TaxID=81972 RepID=D7LXH8_ARALL|nr:hypothetical protein ARALYDRAFT_908318 [Arabidopsis lyrata subsp. lyrata]CAH8270010.1 unnamed protein product [Arabidopsis lyrata]